MELRNVNVGVIGCGVVGTGVVKCLIENIQFMTRHLGCKLNLTAVADLNPNRTRSFEIPTELMTTDSNSIVNNPDIDIVVELIGGTGVAKNIIIDAMQNGKHVVTANKSLISKHGLELQKVAAENKVDFYYEASVCGGIPLIKSIREGLTANQISSVRGIVNGTCNYVLSSMSDEGMSFEAALKDAQVNGFAEADPTLDINGSDSMHKIGILAANCFGQWIPQDQIHVEGIANITDTDIKCAKELGYTIKLLAIAQMVDGKLEARVHPSLLPNNSMLASVRGAFNAVEVKGFPIGRTLYYGEGAGMDATSSAVVADIVDIARNISNDSSTKRPAFALNIEDNIEVRPMPEIKSRYFLRWRTDDRPGVIANISTELSQRGIGISSVILHEFAKVQPYSIVTFMTRETTEKQMHEAIAFIDKLDVIQSPTAMIRVELED